MIQITRNSELIHELSTSKGINRKRKIQKRSFMHKFSFLLVPFLFSCWLIVSYLSLFQPFSQPAEHGRVPLQRIFRFQNPMTFIGEVQELRGHLTSLQASECGNAFRFGDTIVFSAVNHQRGCLPTSEVLIRRKFHVIVVIVALVRCIPG